MKNRITRNEVRAGLGHWPRKRSYRIIKDCEKWVADMLNQYPGTTEGFWWSEVQKMLVVVCDKKRRAEG